MLVEKFNVLDSGYVRLVESFGSDLTVVNTARASFQSETNELRPQDIRLIEFLAEHGHTSPFRHAFLQFEIKAPLLVARQWWKYVVGSDHTMDAWNEASRRYITIKPEFYLPNQFRSAPENKKQGSGGPIDISSNELTVHEYNELYDYCLEVYEKALDRGIAPEQARLALPAYAMYTVWRWTASLQSVSHFLNERLADDAQWEICRYSEAVLYLSHNRFPHSIRSLVSDHLLDDYVLEYDYE